MQAAFRELFKGELTRQSAKDTLRYCDDYAEDVLDTMEAVKARGGIQSPVTCIIRTLQRKCDERACKPNAAVQVAAGQVSAGQVRDAAIGNEGSDDYYLAEPTPKTKHFREVMKKAMAEGRWKPLEEDDDE